MAKKTASKKGKTKKKTKSAGSKASASGKGKGKAQTKTKSKPAKVKKGSEAAASKTKSKGKAAKKKDSVTLAKGSGSTSAKKGGPGIKTQHVDFLTYKVDQLRRFYQEVLGLPSEIQDVEGLNYLVVHTSSSSTLGFMPPHPNMTGEQPGPKEPTMYFLVKDLDVTYQKLLAEGVPFMGEPEEMPWGHRVVTTTDPEGRTIMLAAVSKSK